MWPRALPCLVGLQVRQGEAACFPPSSPGPMEMEQESALHSWARKPGCPRSSLAP